jgi:predicted PurR-regulated permease PerM
MTPALLSAPLLVRILLVLVLAAAVYFFAGFIVPVLAALIIGFASWPLYARLVKACRGNTTWAATIALLVVTLFVVVPLTFAIYYAVGEASAFVQWLLAANREGVSAPAWINALPVLGDDLAGYWNTYLSAPNAISNLTEMISGQHIGNIYRAIVSTTGGLFSAVLFLLFALMTLFFVYKDGHHMATQLDILGEQVLSNRWQHFSRVVPATISATVTGMGLIAIGEGVILGFAYWVAGVPSPVLLGVITAVMAMIPGGAPLSFTLVSLYLVGSGDAVAGIALFLWGSIELFIVDKTLRPRLVGGPVKLPFLPTFFGLVGGVKTMGFVGLFVGPVLMALIVAIWREWVLSMQTIKVKTNADLGQSFHQSK